MKSYIKKPVVISAVQWVSDDARELRCFDCVEIDDVFPTIIMVRTLEGNMPMRRYDWLIRGIEGEYYPCRDSIFCATYEPAEAAQRTAAARGKDR